CVEDGDATRSCHPSEGRKRSLCVRPATAELMENRCRTPCLPIGEDGLQVVACCSWALGEYRLVTDRLVLARDDREGGLLSFGNDGEGSNLPKAEEAGVDLEDLNR